MTQGDSNERRHLLSMDSLELVVLKGILAGVLLTYDKEEFRDLPRGPETSPYTLIKGMSERVNRIFDEEIAPYAGETIHDN